MSESLLCSMVSRSDLLPILLGREVQTFQAKLPIEKIGMGAADVMLFSRPRTGAISFAVVHEKSLRDFFVWLETYAPQFSPITRASRVLAHNDLEYLSKLEVVPIDRSVAKGFAGVVIGEMLAQSGAEPTRVLEGASLGTALQTFSQAYARIVLLWGEEERARGNALRAFDLIRSLNLVPARRLEPEQMRPVWDLVEQSTRKDSPFIWSVVNEAVGFLRRDERIPEQVIFRLANYFEPARELASIVTNTAEDRVLALDRILDVEFSGGSPEALVAGAFSAAYAAVEIGGGTTRHLNLLSEIGEKVPLVWPFFGLLSSIGPSEKWNSNFARVARYVERELLYSFNLVDAPRADISLEELAAIASSKKIDFIGGISRAQQRVLVVEIAPGAVLNVPVGSKQGVEVRGAEGPVLDLAKLDQALAALWELRQSVLTSNSSRVKEAGSSLKETSRPNQNKRRSSKDPKSKTGKLL